MSSKKKDYAARLSPVIVRATKVELPVRKLVAESPPPVFRGFATEHPSDPGVNGWTLLAFLTDSGIVGDRLQPMQRLFIEKGRELSGQGKSLQIENGFNCRDCYHNNCAVIGIYKMINNEDWIALLTGIVVYDTLHNETASIVVTMDGNQTEDHEWQHFRFEDEARNALVDLQLGDWESAHVRCAWHSPS